jgi:hypothetical protein
MLLIGDRRVPSVNISKVMSKLASKFACLRSSVAIRYVTNTWARVPTWVARANSNENAVALWQGPAMWLYNLRQSLESLEIDICHHFRLLL